MSEMPSEPDASSDNPTAALDGAGVADPGEPAPLLPPIEPMDVAYFEKADKHGDYEDR